MPVTPQQAVQKAYVLLQKGDKLNARRWAAYAAQIAPGLEEAWLMLAAISNNPRASLAYLERALQINPASLRARQGLHWARKRLITQQRAKRAASPSVTPRLKAQQKASSMGQMGLVFTLIIMSVFFAFAFWQVQSARPNSPQLGGEKPAQAAHPIVRPTTTPSPVPLPDSNLPQALPLRPETVSSPLAATATLVIAPPTATLFPSPAPPYPTSYQVQPGDTAHHLAVWYGVETSALLAANGMQSVDQVQAGQQINIPAAVYVGPPPSYVVVKRILVDISEQHLYAYKGDALIYSFVASTGMGNSTRVGTFSVLDKIPSAYGATWDIWMPNWMGIYWSGHLENGIHALPILPGGATLWDGYLGAPISYGCVVLSSYEAQLLYDWAEVGTMVEIQW